MTPIEKDLVRQTARLEDRATQELILQELRQIANLLGKILESNRNPPQHLRPRS